jgi:hypothetical protein
VADDFASFSRKIDRLATEFGDRAIADLNKRVGMETKKDVDAAVRGDLGDLSMSNWRRGRPIQVSGRFDVEGDSLIISPAARARGPMRVLEDGRKAGVARARRGRAGRRVSASRGKSTWSDAVSIMEREVPERIAKAVNRAIRQALRG